MTSSDIHPGQRHHGGRGRHKRTLARGTRPWAWMEGLEPRRLLSGAAASTASAAPQALVASKVVFLQSPANVYAGQTIAPALTVAVEDSRGRIVTSDNSTVILQIATGPKGGNLTGTLSISVVKGVASFSDLALSKAGDYVLAASDGDLDPASSADITAELPPTRLVFSQQPPTTVAGQAITPVVVNVENAAGQIVTDDSSAITLSIPAGATTLGGTTTVNAINGVAVFSDLVLIGTGKYALTASDGDLESAKSKPFTITPDVSTSQLFIKQHPAVAPVGRALFPSIIVTVNDQFGNVITTDHSRITLSIFSGPNGAALAGGATQTAMNGAATFKNIIPTLAGSYTLYATDDALMDPAPLAIVATVAPAVSAVATPKTSASYAAGQTPVLSVAVSSSAPKNVPFTGTLSVVDQDNNVLASVSVPANGAVKIPLAGLASGTYACTAVYSGDANHSLASSGPFSVVVNQAASSTSLKASASQLVAGEALTLTAAVDPQTGDAPTGTVIFMDGANQIGGPVQVGTGGTAQITLSLPSAGTHAFTAIYSGDGNFQGSTSGKANVTLKKAGTSISLTPAEGPSVAVNSFFEVTAVVSANAPGAGTPGGTVTFKEGSVVLGIVGLDGSGTAELPGLSFSGPGQYTLVAIYSGDPLDNAVTSSRLEITVS